MYRNLINEHKNIHDRILNNSYVYREPSSLRLPNPNPHQTQRQTKSKSETNFPFHKHRPSIQPHRQAIESNI